MRDDLKDRFALADEVRAPDVWNEARGRAAAGVEAGGTVSGEGSPWTRIGTAAVAFAVFAGAVLFAWSIVSTETERRDVRPRPAAPAPVDLAALLPVGWSQLPAPSEVRSEAVTAWTGSELIVWGGYVFDGSGNKTPRDGGFAFDAASSTWTELPASPLDARAAAGSVWTGSELVVWGGWDGGTGVFGDGATYDPVTRTWRTLPAAPIEAKAPLAVWTGREMVVWGTAVRFPSAPMDGAAYDPASGSWRRIADAPIRLTDATAVWSGEEMIVFGAALDGNNHAETETAVGAAYDPETDTWRELPASDLSPQAHTTAWPGAGEMVAWDYEHASAAYDPASDAWRTLGRVPLEFSECYPQSVAIEGYVFGNFCGQLALYSVNEDAWSELTRGDIADWVIEPAAAGSGFLVMAHSFELSDRPDVTFDARMLAYVPETARALGAVRDPEPFFPPVTVTDDTARMRLVFPDARVPDRSRSGVDARPTGHLVVLRRSVPGPDRVPARSGCVDRRSRRRSGARLRRRRRRSVEEAREPDVGSVPGAAVAPVVDGARSDRGGGTRLRDRRLARAARNGGWVPRRGGVGRSGAGGGVRGSRRSAAGARRRVRRARCRLAARRRDLPVARRLQRDDGGEWDVRILVSLGRPRLRQHLR
jgi:hypothetical protein